MPSPKRPRREPTDDWEQLRHFVGWLEQETYEMLRPIVLFGQTSEARARTVGVSERTLDRAASCYMGTAAARRASRRCSQASFSAQVPRVPA